jgi:hypothetical protein
MKELEKFTNKQLLEEYHRRRSLLKFFSEDDLREELKRREEAKKPVADMVQEMLRPGYYTDKHPGVDLGENG